jgi:hypothetical protein
VLYTGSGPAKYWNWVTACACPDVGAGKSVKRMELEDTDQNGTR